MILDIALLLLAIAGFWLGYTKGLARTLFSVLKYAIAVLLTLVLAPWIMSLMINWFNADKMFALIFGTIFTMIGMIFLIQWLFKSVEKYLKKTKSDRFNKSLGGIVMLLATVVVFSFLANFVVQLGWVGEKTTATSYTYSTLSRIPAYTKSIAAEFRPLFGRYWDLMENTYREGKAKPVN